MQLVKQTKNHFSLLYSVKVTDNITVHMCYTSTKVLFCLQVKLKQQNPLLFLYSCSEHAFLKSIWGQLCQASTLNRKGSKEHRVQTKLKAEVTKVMGFFAISYDLLRYCTQDTSTGRHVLDFYGIYRNS